MVGLPLPDHAKAPTATTRLRSRRIPDLNHHPREGGHVATFQMASVLRILELRPRNQVQKSRATSPLSLA